MHKIMRLHYQPRDEMEDIKMEVKETAGEVSASIEETNRVRAALGMAPLKEGASKSSKEDEAKVNGRERAEAAASEAAEDALRDKIDKQRRQRLLHLLRAS